jgi:hypothetical protein
MAHLQSVTPPILPPLSAFADASHPVVGRDGAEAVLAAMRGAAGFGQANTSSVAELFGSMSARLVAFNPAAQVIDPALGGASAFRARGERDARFARKLFVFRDPFDDLENTARSVTAEPMYEVILTEWKLLNARLHSPYGREWAEIVLGM